MAQRPITTERRLALLTLPKLEGSSIPTKGHMMKQQSGQETETKVRGKHGPEPLLCFPWKKQGRQENSLAMANVNKVSGL